MARPQPRAGSRDPGRRPADCACPQRTRSPGPLRPSVRTADSRRRQRHRRLGGGPRRGRQNPGNRHPGAARREREPLRCHHPYQTRVLRVRARGSQLRRGAAGAHRGAYRPARALRALPGHRPRRPAGATGRPLLSTVDGGSWWRLTPRADRPAVRGGNIARLTSREWEVLVLTDAVARLLRRHRQRLRLTQEELAGLAGISTRTIGEMERNRGRGPRPDTVERLATALRLSGVDREEFVRAGRELFWANRAGRREAAPAARTGYPRSTDDRGDHGTAGSRQDGVGRTFRSPGDRPFPRWTDLCGPPGIPPRRPDHGSGGGRSPRSRRLRRTAGAHTDRGGGATRPVPQRVGWQTGPSRTGQRAGCRAGEIPAPGFAVLPDDRYQPPAALQSGGGRGRAPDISGPAYGLGVARHAGSPARRGTRHRSPRRSRYDCGAVRRPAVGACDHGGPRRPPPTGLVGGPRREPAQRTRGLRGYRSRHRSALGLLLVLRGGLGARAKAVPAPGPPPRTRGRYRRGREPGRAAAERRRAAPSRADGGQSHC